MFESFPWKRNPVPKSLFPEESGAHDELKFVGNSFKKLEIQRVFGFHT
jgi:hypothetical protein